mmetsp:Transcript_26137/g.87517  ORF Transcript_26137/g.87517 Transcript_26137/m.87517 type:complete len:257 (-) Transcript_26137:884-1654(-)
MHPHEARPHSLPMPSATCPRPGRACKPKHDPRRSGRSAKGAAHWGGGHGVGSDALAAGVVGDRRLRVVGGGARLRWRRSLRLRVLLVSDAAPGLAPAGRPAGRVGARSGARTAPSLVENREPAEHRLEPGLAGVDDKGALPHSEHHLLTPGEAEGRPHGREGPAGGHRVVEDELAARVLDARVPARHRVVGDHNVVVLHLADGHRVARGEGDPLAPALAVVGPVDLEEERRGHHELLLHVRGEVALAGGALRRHAA